MTDTNDFASKTECSQQVLLFPEITNRPIAVDFEAGHVSSDGGVVLLARLDRQQGYLERLAACFADHRKPELIEHSVVDLLRQRVYALCQGYEDLNDHDALSNDPLFASACGKKDPLGQNRARKKDRGKALGGKSTLNRLELTPGNADSGSRYKKIVADPIAIENFFIGEYVRSLPGNTTQVTLDLDATDDLVHGHQEGRFFHGYYGNYCYLPLYIFDGDWPIVAWLRTSDRDASDGALDKIKKIVAALRKRFPNLKIRLRADSGFCRDELMVWCELNEVKYLLGLARNPVLERKLAAGMARARELSQAQGGKAARVFVEMTYRAKRWHAPRWVIGKAEWTQGESNPRFIISNEDPLSYEAQALYEKDYCARGNMENRIKEQQLDLYADRTSAESMQANQLRLWFSTMAYLLMNQLRRVGLSGTELAKAACGTIRLKLLKIGALVRVSVRRVWVSLSSAYPGRALFAGVAERLCLQTAVT
jgi:hypothetical protein